MKTHYKTVDNANKGAYSAINNLILRRRRKFKRSREIEGEGVVSNSTVFVMLFFLRRSFSIFITFFYKTFYTGIYFLFIQKLFHESVLFTFIMFLPK